MQQILPVNKYNIELFKDIVFKQCCLVIYKANKVIEGGSKEYTLNFTDPTSYSSKFELGDVIYKISGIDEETNPALKIHIGFNSSMNKYFLIKSAEDSSKKLIYDINQITPATIDLKIFAENILEPISDKAKIEINNEYLIKSNFNKTTLKIMRYFASESNNTLVGCIAKFATIKNLGAKIIDAFK